jgi:hypothetical protein
MFAGLYLYSSPESSLLFVQASYGHLYQKRSYKYNGNSHVQVLIADVALKTNQLSCP